MPGLAIAAVRELKSSLWATAGGKRAEIRPNTTLADMLEQALEESRQVLPASDPQCQVLGRGDTIDAMPKQRDNEDCVQGTAVPQHLIRLGLGLRLTLTLAARNANAVMARRPSVSAEERANLARIYASGGFTSGKDAPSSRQTLR